MQWRAWRSTLSVCARQVFDGSLISLSGEYLIRFLHMFLMILIWKSVAGQGVDMGGMTLKQLLTYTLMASVLRQQLDIITPATAALWEGSIINRYTRPMPVIVSLMLETIGKWWIPVFLLYSLPVLAFSPVLGISPFPANAAAGVCAFVSLCMSVSLGFAIDLLFSALAIRLKNGCWAALQIRESIHTLLSGALIPFALMPWGLGRILSFLPFGSIASAPLTIYTGIGQSPWRTVGLQVFWNLLLWPLAVFVFHKSEEGMVSYGS